MIAYHGHAGLALIQLPDPALQPLNEDWVESLAAALDRYTQDDEADWALLAPTAGASFCRGAELNQLGLSYNSDAMRLVVDQIRRCDKPVAAFVQGQVWGGGAELVLACDVLLADASFDFSLPEIRGGLPPAAGACLHLPRRVGTGLAWEWLSSGASVPLAAALASGLVDAACPDLQAARDWIGQLPMRQWTRPPREAAITAPDLDPAAVLARIDQAPSSVQPALQAVHQVLQLGASDFAAGYALELSHYRQLEISPQRRRWRELEASLSFCRRRWGSLPEASTGLGPPGGSAQPSSALAGGEGEAVRAVFATLAADQDGAFAGLCVDFGPPTELAGEGLLRVQRLRMRLGAAADAPALLSACIYGGQPHSVIQLGDISALDSARAGALVARLAGAGLVVLHDGPAAQPLGPALLQDWGLTMQSLDPTLEIERLWSRWRQALAGETPVPDPDWLAIAEVALLNSGARMLDAAVAGNPQDIDMALIFGYGLAAEHAPMQKGLRQGLDQALAQLQRLQARLGERFCPAGLLQRIGRQH